MTSKRQKKLTFSQENYLQAIYNIIQVNQVARVKDISAALEIGAPSVSEALKILEEKKLINYIPYGFITLTEEGAAIAEDLNNSQETIKAFLMNVLQIEESKAENNADTIVHTVSSDVRERLTRFLTFTQICPCKEPKWMRGFQAYSKTGSLSDKCQNCINYCKEKGITKPIADADAVKTGNKCCGMNEEIN